MAKSFSCPSCGAPLDYHGVMSTIQCPYCFTSSQVPEELRAEQGTTVEPGVMLNYMAQATKLRELAAAVKAGDKQKATELYKLIYKVGPDEAARAVGQLTGGGAVLVSGAVPTSPPSMSSVPTVPGYTPPSFPPPPPPSAAPTFSSSPTLSSPNYASVPTVTAYPPVSSAPATRSNPRLLVVAIVGLVLCCFVAAMGVGIALLSGDTGETLDTTTSVAVDNSTLAVAGTRAASNATEQAQAATFEAGRPTKTPLPTNTQDPGPGETATAEALAQATADAGLLSEAQAWPVSFKDDFSVKSNHWATDQADNEVYTGSQTIAKGVFDWEAKSKGSFVSFISPEPYQSVTDFYAAVDLTITGDSHSAGGLAFRDGPDSDSGYYVFVVDLEGNYVMEGFQSGTQISHSGSIEPLKDGAARIGVVAQGSHFLLLVNDQIIDSIDDPFLNAGDVGLAITMANPGDEASFTFDNFEIRTPK